MTNKEKPNADRSGAWSTALRILTRRDYSRAELKEKLLDKGFDTGIIDETLNRCLEYGYLDDARFALNRATMLMKLGRAVGPRVLADLRQRGISDELANKALEQAREEYDERQLLKALLEKRFPDFNYDSAPAKERRRVVHFLQRRGFQLGRILELLTRKGLETRDENRE